MGNARSHDQLGLLGLNQINLAEAHKAFEKSLQYAPDRSNKYAGFH
jgi:cytochrome c-type biogenesis protein CcmH/NrfG